MGKSDSTKPDFSYERDAYANGAKAVAGVDEAGRGPLAGSVVAAAVILDPTRLPQGLNDSKKLSPARRDALFEEIIKTARVGIAAAPVALIDRLNIRGATLWAMRQAILYLAEVPDLTLIDGRDIPKAMPGPARSLIGGDTKSLSIAAASIIAKVTRDRMCTTLHADSPAYGFLQHKGYGTQIHLQALTTIGASRHHRTGFAPVAAVLAGLEK